MAALASLFRPSNEGIHQFVARQERVQLSYAEIALSRYADHPPGFYYTHRTVCLGNGQTVFQTACDGLSKWRMFETGWTSVYDSHASIAAGQNVSVLIRSFGLWWLCGARIVYAIDETTADGARQFGFAYGTTTDHVERGEERFLVEWRPDDTVWYDLFAFSQPNHVIARLGGPFTRMLQYKFGTDSLAAIKRLTIDDS